MKNVISILSLISLLLVMSVTADEVAVTVYNSNLGVVSETRTLDFNKGVGKLAFRDVPSQIDASSVRFDIVDASKNVSILEQNYAFDLVSPDKMYRKYIDKQIELIDSDGRLYTGTLLAPSSNSVTLLDQSGRVKIVSLKDVTEVNFPVLPDGLITRPTLFWLYNSDYKGSLECNVDYQTTGISWTAEYVALLNEKETELDLSGWASIDNTSGKTYQDAKLKLIAGDINRAPQPRVNRGYGDVEMMAMAKGTAYQGFEEKAFFEYHMYTLPRRATVADKEIKQIALFEPASSEVEKIYEFNSGKGTNEVSVKIEFANSSETGLGMPLPEGRVRIFKADSDGSLILLGEDRVKHTPRDEKVSLKVGTAFDIVGEEKLVDQARISKMVEDRTFEIELRNRKNEDVTVKVNKDLYGFWEILESNFTYEKEDANTVSYEIPVKAGETTTLTLKVRFTSK